MELLICPLNNDELEILTGAVSVAGAVIFGHYRDPVLESDVTRHQLLDIGDILRPLRGKSPVLDVELPRESWKSIVLALTAVLFEYEGRRWRGFTVISPRWDIDNSRGIAEAMLKKISDRIASSHPE